MAFCKVNLQKSQIVKMLEAVEIFVAVAARGTFSKVAEARGVAVSSITRKIGSLESELGAKLFNRSSRSLVLTDAGENFLPRAQNILAEIAEAKDAASALSVEPRGMLSITAPTTFGRRHVAPAVASFLLKFPLMQVDLHLGDEMIDVAAERVDVAVRIGVLPDSDLLATKLAAQRRVACASPEYLALAGAPKSAEELLKHRCLTVRSAHSRVGWWRFRGTNNYRPLAVKGPFRTDDSDALMQAAIGGLGVAHLATWLVGEEIAAGRLISLFREELELSEPAASAIYAVRMPGRTAAKSKLFIEFLRSHFGIDGGRPPYWDRWLEKSKRARR
jgi:DNA-binding transcriptional LysR family regulator